MENDYKNSVIYRIYCKNQDITDCYIGSTKCFEDRFNFHKNSTYNKNLHFYKYKVYQFIRDNGGWDNFNKEILEYYSCNNKVELKLKEQEYISNYKPTLNTHNAYATEEIKKQQRFNSYTKFNKSEYGLEYRERYRKEKKYCKYCDSFITKGGWAKHTKTKIHLKNVEKNQ
tara:strand:+ start:278 stop:790 length:513 start_codon:yes stop_codon:yes gene_type:complete